MGASILGIFLMMKRMKWVIKMDVKHREGTELFTYSDRNGKYIFSV